MTYPAFVRSCIWGRKTSLALAHLLAASARRASTRVLAVAVILVVNLRPVRGGITAEKGPAPRGSTWMEHRPPCRRPTCCRAASILHSGHVFHVAHTVRDLTPI